MTPPNDPRTKGPVAFILGLEENGYGTLRSLAVKKVPCLGIYNDPLHSGRFSRHCKAVYLDPSLAEPELCQTLIRWSRNLDHKPVLFATTDRFALLLARQREVLSPHFAFHWVCAESLSRIIDKARMSQLCLEAGILSPKTHITQPGEDLAASVKDFSFPCLIKPIRSFQTGFPYERNFWAESPAALLEFYRQNPALLGLTIWQEIIEGEDDEVFQCTTFIRKSGEFGPLFLIRKIHQFPPGFGSMCFGRSEENDCVARDAVSLLHLLDHRGFASLEFKRRPRDGGYYFIEMNPRLPWYNALFRDAGINLPFLAYLDLSERSQFELATTKQKNDVYWITLERDFKWFLQKRRVHRTNLQRWLTSVLKARSFAWWSWRDPLPFFHSTLRLLAWTLRKLKKPFAPNNVGRIQPVVKD
jgi:predicted ATP-grasp superfamily ATP-dependent carboligase